MAGGVVYLLAKYADLVVNDQSQYILSILVIGAGTDYALLLVARYREELRRHEDRHEAMAFALHRAAPGDPGQCRHGRGRPACAWPSPTSTRPPSLGPVLAVGVAVTFLVMVTLLPALLVIFGRWIFWPRRPAFGSPEPTQTGPLGPRRRADHACGRAWSGSAPPSLLARRLPRPVQARRRRPVDRGHLHQGVRLDHGAEAAGRARPRRQLQHRAGRGQRRDELAEVPEAVAGVDGLGSPTDADLARRRSVLLRGADQARTSPPTPAFDIVEEARDAVHARRRGRRAGRRRLGVLPRHQDRARSATTR